MARFTLRGAAAGVMALGVLLASGMSASASTRAVPSFVQPGTVAAGAVGGHVSHDSTPIQEQPCTSGRKTWVHIDSADGLQCFGFAGTAAFDPYPRLYEFCAGNNHGSFEVFDSDTGKYSSGNYSAGFARDYGNGIYIVSVTIKGWSGSDSC
jgi:hypothetical protein